ACATPRRATHPRSVVSTRREPRARGGPGWGPAGGRAAPRECPTSRSPHRAQVDVEFRVAVADSAGGLPAACGSVVWVDETGCSGDVVVCGMQEQAARDLARWLARFEDPEAPAATSLPAEVRLSEVEGIAIG